MATIAQDTPVNTMTPISDLGPRLRRDVAFRRAGTLLGIAIRARQEQPGSTDASWCLETVRSVIEGFELETSGREPDAVVAARQAAITEGTAKLQAAIESRLLQERSRARLAASERGHELATWHAKNGSDGEESAVCYRCGRNATITLGDEPVLSGSALTEGCLSISRASEPSDDSSDRIHAKSATGDK